MKQIIGNSLWMVEGYFNLIRSLEGKKGGLRRLDQVSNDFNGY